MSPKSCSGSSLTLIPVKGMRQAPPEVFLLRAELGCWGEGEEKLGRKGGLLAISPSDPPDHPQLHSPLSEAIPGQTGRQQGCQGTSHAKGSFLLGQAGTKAPALQQVFKISWGRGLEKGSRVNWQWGGLAEGGHAPTLQGAGA